MVSLFFLSQQPYGASRHACLIGTHPLKLHKSKKGSCWLLKAGIGKNLCICVDKKGFRHVEWAKSPKTQVWKPRINSSKAHVKTGLGCDLGPMDISSPCPQRLVFSDQHSPNRRDPNPLPNFLRSSSWDTFFSWASLICFPTTQVSMGLNPFLVADVWPELHLSGCLLSSGEKFSLAVHRSEPIPEFEHRPSVSSRMLVKLASKWAVDLQRAMVSYVSVPPMAGLPLELVL